jgi:hypothetical protein
VFGSHITHTHTPVEMVAQSLKRAGKRTWRPERVVRIMGGGGVACGPAAGVVSAAGLKVLVVVLQLVSFSMVPTCVYYLVK